jgi:hypothetical protein
MTTDPQRVSEHEAEATYRFQNPVHLSLKQLLLADDARTDSLVPQRKNIRRRKVTAEDLR